MTIIKTFNELSELVSKDNEKHSIKKLAELLLLAMNDWPSIHQDLIEVFILELKSFYSEGITIENINSKKIDFRQDLNAWRAESGTYIIELIKESKRNFNETDFDLIISKILNYYSNVRTNN